MQRSTMQCYGYPKHRTFVHSPKLEKARSVYEIPLDRMPRHQLTHQVTLTLRRNLLGEGTPAKLRPESLSTRSPCTHHTTRIAPAMHRRRPRRRARLRTLGRRPRGAQSHPFDQGLPVRTFASPWQPTECREAGCCPASGPALGCPATALVTQKPPQLLPGPFGRHAPSRVIRS